MLCTRRPLTDAYPLSSTTRKGTQSRTIRRDREEKVEKAGYHLRRPAGLLMNRDGHLPITSPGDSSIQKA